MKRVRITQMRPKSRVIKLATILGLATLFVVAFLLGAQRTSEAHANLFAPQLPAQKIQLLNSPKDTLLVGTSADYWPMEYFSGTQIVGHDIDLMNAIAAKMEVTVVYTDVAFGEILTGLAEGNYDAVISTVSVTPYRDEMIDYTFPYVTFMGNDNVAIAVQQGDTILRQQINEALWQLRSEGTLGTIVEAIADDSPEWQPSIPDWPYISPDNESTLVYTDTKQSPTIIHIPRGAVTETILLGYTALNTVEAPSGSAFAGHAFELETYQNGI